MSCLRVRAAGPLRGRVRLPGDLHVGQQALVWAALAEGTSRIEGMAPRHDHQALSAALSALGVAVRWTDDGVLVPGVGLSGLRLPAGALFAGESPSTLEILTALLSPQRFGTRIEARGLAASHPLNRLIEPLRQRGAQVAGRGAAEGVLTAPVAVAPLLESERLASVEIDIPLGDPVTKLALLLTGLYAGGVTLIREGVLSRDHAERALVALGCPVTTAGSATMLDTGDRPARLEGFRWRLPGDFSLASYLFAAALIVPGSELVIEALGVNRSRTGFLDVLRHAGAQVAVAPKGDTAGNEPIANLRARASRLRGIQLAGELALRARDEIYPLAALAAAMGGRLRVRDVEGLREGPDRLKALVRLLRQFGAECTAYQDGFDLDPMSELQPVRVDANELAEVKLLACVLGSRAPGETIIEAPETLDALYPGGIETLASLGASIVREG